MCGGSETLFIASVNRNGIGVLDAKVQNYLVDIMKEGIPVICF